MLSARAPNILLDRQQEFAARGFASKTPGRHVLPSTAGLKSALRKENAHAPKTTLARSKATINLADEAIQPKQLFKEASSKAPLGKGLSDVTNKTPAPAKRQALAFKTPLPGTSKISKLAPLLSAEPEVGPAPAPAPLEPPPSALRPNSSRRTSRVIRSTSKSFETPVPSARKHWDVSDGDISVGVVSDMSLREEINEDGEDEIEYMAPTAWIEPYEPPFPLPDYKALCPKIMEVARMPCFGDDVDIFDDSFLETWVPEEVKPEECQIPLRSLAEDELFGPPVAVPKVSGRIAKSSASRNMSMAASRVGPPRSQASSAPPRPSSRPAVAARPAPTRTQVVPARYTIRPTTKNVALGSKPAAVHRKTPAQKPADTLEVFFAPTDVAALDDDFKFDV